MLLAQMLQQVAPGAALRRPPAMAYEQPEEVQRLRSQDPDFLRLSLTPLDDEQGQLDKQMQLANALMQGSGRQYASPFGAAIGGLSDVIRMGVGAHRMGNLEQEQQGLNTRRQEMIDAAGRGPSTVRLQKALGMDPATEELRRAGLDLAREKEDRLARDAAEREERLRKEAEAREEERKRKIAASAKGAKEKGERDSFTRETGLRKEFDSLPEVKEFRGMGSNYETLKQAAADPSGPAGITTIFSFMKMLDPGVAVMEGDVNLIRSSGGPAAKWANVYEQALTGNPIPENVRRDILKQADVVYRNKQGLYEKQRKRYEQIAKDGKVEPSRVVAPGQPDIDLSAPSATQAPAKSGPKSIASKQTLADGTEIVLYTDGTGERRVPKKAK